jgi:hypothetical protein
LAIKELLHGLDNLILDLLGDKVKFLGELAEHIDDKLAEENNTGVLILIIPELLEQIPT